MQANVRPVGCAAAGTAKNAGYSLISGPSNVAPFRTWAEAKTAKAAQKEATRTTKAGAKARRAVAKEAKNEEQEQKTAVVSTGYNIGTGGGTCR